MSPSAARPAVTLARMLPAARESTSLLSAPTAAAKLVFPSSRRPIARSTAASASRRCARTADLTASHDRRPTGAPVFHASLSASRGQSLPAARSVLQSRKPDLRFSAPCGMLCLSKLQKLDFASSFCIFPPYRAVKHKRESRRFPSRRKQQWTERNRLPP